MSDQQPISQLPFQVTPEEFARAASEINEEGACCLFVIDNSIPSSARSGYAALVIAYARADEPVCILDGGAAALLVRHGGVGSGEIVARRVLAQMRRLSLDSTLRAGVVPLGADPEAILSAARTTAEAAPAGEVRIAA